MYGNCILGEKSEIYFTLFLPRNKILSTCPIHTNDYRQPLGGFLCYYDSVDRCFIQEQIETRVQKKKKPVGNSRRCNAFRTSNGSDPTTVGQRGVNRTDINGFPSIQSNLISQHTHTRIIRMSHGSRVALNKPSNTVIIKVHFSRSFPRTLPLSSTLLCPRLTFINRYATTCCFPFFRCIFSPLCFIFYPFTRFIFFFFTRICATPR